MSQFFESGGQSIGVSASASSNEYSGLISFRIDWFQLFAVQGTLKGLLQHHSSKAAILRCSAFFMVHLSHPYSCIITVTINHPLLGETFCTHEMWHLRVCLRQVSIPLPTMAATTQLCSPYLYFCRFNFVPTWNQLDISISVF